MRFAAALLASVCFVTLTAVAGGQAPAANTRDAFLKMIDRPRVALDPTVQPRSESDGLAAETISFAAQTGQRVPAVLLKQQAGRSRRPVVIVLHGTGGSKDGMVPRLRELAARGFVAVAIDGRYHGERAPAPAGHMNPYQDAILRAFRTGGERPFLYDTVWDVMRLIDYLETRSDVDASRIGLAGISKGGMETYLAAAVDRRIAAAVPLIGVQSFRWSLDHGAWDSRAWTMREAIDAAAKESGEGVGVSFMRRFYDRVAPGIYGDFDGPAMLPLIAPRPLLVINGDSDPRTPIGGVRECMAAAEQAYKAAGAVDRLRLQLQPNTGHQVTAEADRAVVAWFQQWLRPAS
jgi:dienelactone hydrolase